MASKYMSTKEIAAIVRKWLKDEYGLTNRDVSVKADSATSVNINIKSLKALPHMKAIEEKGKSHETIYRDHASGEILSGGNTFVFVGLDWNFEKKVNSIIEQEYNRVTKNKGLEEGQSVVLFGSIQVTRTTTDDYFIEDKKDHNNYTHVPPYLLSHSMTILYANILKIIYQSKNAKAIIKKMS